MKKTLIAVAALAATASFAQVSVYGRLDAGYGNYTTTSAAGVDTKRNGVQSKNSVSSMWGIKGTEDLGGGMKAFFQLERNIDTASGAETATAGAGADRTSLIGLTGGFGSVAFGRDYTPMFKLIGSSEVNGFSNLSTVQLNDPEGGGASQPNQIIYNSPSFSGFQANLGLTNGDTSSGTSEDKVVGNSVTATYTNGPLMVGVGVGSHEVTTAGVASKTEGRAIVAGYNFGVVALKGNMIVSKNVQTGVESKENNLGLTAPFGKVTLVAQIGSNDSGAATNNTGNDFVVGADYALSAKTALYAKTGTVNKIGDAKTTGTAVGIKTVF